MKTNTIDIRLVVFLYESQGKNEVKMRSHIDSQILLALMMPVEWC